MKLEVCAQLFHPGAECNLQENQNIFGFSGVDKENEGDYLWNSGERCLYGPLT